MSIKQILISILLVLLIGCATYHQKTFEFQRLLMNGDIDGANNVLMESEKKVKTKDKLLFLFNKGVVLQLLGKYEESNQFFEDAYLVSEDMQKNYSLEALSLISNPGVKPYYGEDFELVLIHYYKTLNFMMMDNIEAALVECRRLNIRLNQLNDKYTKKNRYQRDAFALNLMGILYEASNDYNNAFIAYRNAYQAYKEDYVPMFNTETPTQLKKDLLRLSYINGFNDDLKIYEEEFGMKYSHQSNSGEELIFFWNNGLGPVKDEWSINFVVLKGAGGVVHFENKEMGFSFPFFLGGKEDGSSPGLGDLKVVRVAFPKYSERKPIFNSAIIEYNGKEYSLEVAENINAIAFKTLEDRMVRELANSLLRLAIKQAAEAAIRKQNEGIGALVSIATALTEKADTRNWQTLPYSISYVRVPIDKSKNQYTFKAKSTLNKEVNTTVLSLNTKIKKCNFMMFHNIDIVP